MREWHCFHLDDTLTAMATSDGRRFLVRLREPAGPRRNAIESHRWTLTGAMAAIPAAFRRLARRAASPALQGRVGGGRVAW